MGTTEYEYVETMGEKFVLRINQEFMKAGIANVLLMCCECVANVLRMCCECVANVLKAGMCLVQVTTTM